MMNKKRPLILISNDDGVGAEGIRQLTKALRDLGDVVVFAPDGPRSGMSCALTTTGPVKYNTILQDAGLTVYSCTGMPVDCVKLAVSEVLPCKPDLLVSGINHGGNQALSVHYSGTMGAAFEGCVFDIPSIGVSMYRYVGGADFSASCRYAYLLAVEILKRGLPHGVYLNLNVPNIPVVRGLRTGRQTDGKWIHEYEAQRNERGEMLYWITGEYKVYGAAYPDNDVALLNEGYASLVPCKLDMTDYAFMEELKMWTIQ
jgi:5'-nucleotidase